ncbi:Uncharacterised protein g2316 [Pycnogonum litorale]
MATLYQKKEYSLHFQILNIILNLIAKRRCRARVLLLQISKYCKNLISFVDCAGQKSKFSRLSFHAWLTKVSRAYN